MNFDNLLNKLYSLAKETNNPTTKTQLLNLTTDIKKNGLPDNESFNQFLANLTNITPPIPENSLIAIYHLSNN
ncbi:hypothetical protein [Enterococcus sp. LJL90]